MLLHKYYTFVKQKLNYANNNKPFLIDSKINLSNVNRVIFEYSVRRLLAIPRLYLICQYALNDS